MKIATRVYYLGFILMLTVSTILGISFRSPVKDEMAARLITEQFNEGLTSVLEATKSLHEKAVSLEEQDEQSLEELQKSLILARNKFKEIEYLLSFLSEEFVKDWVNGAPLLKIERNSPSVLTVLEPEGLQILDELIFSDEVFDIKKDIVQKSSKLTSQIKQYKNFFSQGTFLTDAQIFDATREELVRIFTLGLTGFDTPSSGNSMAEAYIAMKSLHNAMSHYRERIAKVDAQLYDDIDSLFIASITHLHEYQNDFDTYDRLFFLKSYINPLFDLTGKAIYKLGLPVLSKASQIPLSVNSEASNLFSNDFLYAGAFTDYGARNADQKIIELGRMLFFDPALSQTNERSCASCHQPGKAFTDGLSKSIATDFEGTVDRNAPTLINSVFAKRFFHDMRAHQLEGQIEHVIVDEKEFRTSYFKLFEKLMESKEYITLFEEAFPDHPQKPIINSYTLPVAITAYVKSLSSFNSPFDLYVRGETDHISDEVRNGFNIFMGKGACGTCHFAPVFNGTVPPRFQESESEVLGVPLKHNIEAPILDPDLGRYANGRPTEKAKFYQHSFKTPTVRNIALTAPYMHNGGYETLEEVMDFYNRGGGAGMGLDVPYQTLPFDSLSLQAEEIHDVISFMEALTDTVGLTTAPSFLPSFPKGSPLNDRVVGGTY